MEKSLEKFGKVTEKYVEESEKPSYKKLNIYMKLHEKNVKNLGLFEENVENS